MLYRELLHCLLIIALGFGLAAPGIVGLMVIVLATAFNGITEEHRIGHAFEEALPFTALLVVFFAIVAVIDHQKLFTPVIHWVMTYDGKLQEALFYLANGVLSMISDNVFVATVYIGEVEEMFKAGDNHSRAFQFARGRDQYRYQYSVRGNTKRSGGIPVPVDVGAGTADSLVVRQDGGDGDSYTRSR